MTQAAFSDALNSQFEMRALGELKWFLGIRVIRDRSARKTWLSQQSHIEGIANRLGCATLRRLSTSYPWEPLAPFDDDATVAEMTMCL